MIEIGNNVDFSDEFSFFIREPSLTLWKFVIIKSIVTQNFPFFKPLLKKKYIKFSFAK